MPQGDAQAVESLRDQQIALEETKAQAAALQQELPQMVSAKIEEANSSVVAAGAEKEHAAAIGQTSMAYRQRSHL